MKPDAEDTVTDAAAGAYMRPHVSEERGRNAVLGIGWSALNTGSAMLIAILVFIVTSRVLGPEEFGIVALALSIITVVGSATPGGFGEAIIQRSKISDSHLDTVFWICVGSGVVLYLPILLLSGTVAKASGEPVLAYLLPFFGLKLILDLAAVVPQALVVRAMQFKYVAARTAIGNSVGGFVCVIMALNGYGLWALAMAPMMTSIVSLAILARAARWRPGTRPSLGALRELLRFGMFSSGNNALHLLNIDRLVLGFLAGPAVLGLYYLGKRLFDILSGVTMGAIYPVTTVYFASIQNEPGKHVGAFRNAVRATTIVAFPIFGGLYVLADSAVPLILGDHWLPALPAVKAFAIIGLFGGLMGSSVSLANGLGRADLSFLVDSLRNLLSVGAILLALDSGFEAVMGALVLVHAVMLPSGFLIARKLTGISLWDYIAALLLPALTTLAMVGAILSLSMALPGVLPAPLLALEFGVGAALYIGLTLSFSRRQIAELRQAFSKRTGSSEGGSDMGRTQVTHHAIGGEVQLPEMAGQPRISVIMANLNGAAHLEQAIRSVLEQTHPDLELVISDDGSTDDSLRIIRAAMARDPRVRMIESAAPTGPGAARNRAMAAAKGDWIAICDSDDIIHPERLARLLRAAQSLDADLVADDLIYFGDDPLERHKTLLQALALQRPQAIDAMALVSGNLCGVDDLSLGYLKPLIRRATLGKIRYNEELFLDEDYDLYLRLVVSGARFVVIPDAMYLYRRHAKSTSHRIAAASLERMVRAQASFLQDLSPDNRDLASAVAERMQCHAVELQYVQMVDAMKARNWLTAAGRLLRNPRSLFLLVQSLRERGRRRRQGDVATRTRLDLVLCEHGRETATEFPGFTRFEVPAITSAAWSPSAADIWADLARLACEHDLHILAADRAGKFALGLVPQFGSAEIRDRQPGPKTTGGAPGRAGPAFFASEPAAEGV